MLRGIKLENQHVNGGRQLSIFIATVAAGTGIHSQTSDSGATELCVLLAQLAASDESRRERKISLLIKWANKSTALWRALFVRSVERFPDNSFARYLITNTSLRSSLLGESRILSRKCRLIREQADKELCEIKSRKLMTNASAISQRTRISC